MLSTSYFFISLFCLSSTPVSLLVGVLLISLLGGVLVALFLFSFPFACRAEKRANGMQSIMHQMFLVHAVNPDSLPHPFDRRR